MKLCSSCGAEKNLSDFGKNKSRKNGLQSECKQCRNQKRREWYSKNQQVQIERTYNSRIKRKKKTLLQLIDYYRNNPCIDCGETDWRVLDSDHQHSKEFGISKMFTFGYSWEKISLELEKCETRCANCHRKRTANQLGWYSYLAGEGSIPSPASI